MLVYSANGFVTSLPDYLGFGSNPGFQAYLHAETEGSASEDMLNASRAACAQNKVAVSSELYLAGYSQGGHATMALQRQLERDKISVTASLPMAGPYDLSHISVKSALTAPTTSSSGYASLLLLAMDQIYHVFHSLADSFMAPFDGEMMGLFSGNYDLAYIDPKLPPTPAELLTPAIQQAVLSSDPQNKLVQALERNDLYHWTPVAPIYMYHAKGDHDVPFENSELACREFRSRNATVSLVNLGDELGHASGAGVALVLSLEKLLELHQSYAQAKHHVAVP